MPQTLLYEKWLETIELLLRERGKEVTVKHFEGSDRFNTLMAFRHGMSPLQVAEALEELLTEEGTDNGSDSRWQANSGRR